MEEKKQELMEVEKPILKKFTTQIVNVLDRRSMIKEFLNNNPLFYDKSRNWWVWNDDEYCWVIVDEVDILNSINKYTNLNTLNSSERNEILEGLRQEGRKRIPKPIKRDWIQFRERIYKIGEDDFILASPEYFVTNPIPWDIGKSKETPIIDRIFEEWVGPKYVKTLYQIIAYCLLPDYPMQRLFCFTGGGMNGKSCFLELVKRFLGKDNVTTTELDVLIDSRFEITRLYKKLACMLGETNFNEIKKTSILKKLTGNDLIGYEYKNKTPFEDYNYAKILISTNNLPTTTDKTLGFFRRWLIIDFPNRFSERKDILCDIPNREYNNLARKCIDVLWNLLKTREFHNEGTPEDRMRKFEEKSDPLGKFLKDYTTEDGEAFIYKFEFMKKFNDWCNDNNFRTFSDEYVGRKMKDSGYETTKKLANWFSNEGARPQIRAWQGLKWLNS